MAPKLLSLHLLVTLLTIITLEFAQAGSDTSPNPLSKVKASSGSVLVTRVMGGVGDRVLWTDWTSGDGLRTKKDRDGIFFIDQFIRDYIYKYPDPNYRIGVFWAGGTNDADIRNIDEFIQKYIPGRGRRYDGIVNTFGQDIYYDMDLRRWQGVDFEKDDEVHLWYRIVYRASKALAAAADGGTAYVYLKPNNCRNLFSPPSQNPQDSDPDHGGEATNDEVFYWAQLPTLMRNLNVRRIVTFYKKSGPGEPAEFVLTTQWNVAVDTTKPRDLLPDIAIDADPIILPPQAGRPPMKRDTLPNGAISSVGYQKGLFEVKTTSISDLTADSATICTATSASVVITTIVPIWSCSSCSTPYNAIVVSPVSIVGSAGIPSPPPGYKPLSVGPDLNVTPISLPTASTNSVGPNVTNSYGETYRYPSPSMTSQFFPLNSASSASAGRATVTGSGSIPGPSSQKSISQINSTKMYMAPGGTTSSGESSSSSPSVWQSSSLQSSSSISSGTRTNSSAIGIGGKQTSTLSLTSRSSGSGSSATPSSSLSSATSSALAFIASSTGSSGSKTTPTTTSAPDIIIVPTATLARSSASALSSSIVVIAPVWQDFIDQPTKNKGVDLINKIQGLESLAKEFEHKIGPPPSGDDKDCSVNTNLISDIFNAAKCLTDNLDRAKVDIETAIENKFDDLTNPKDELENVQNLEKALENDTKEDDEKQSKSASQSNPSSTQSNSQSSSSSCNKFQTASDCSAICSGVTIATSGSTAYSSQGCSTTCFSTFSGCSATNSIKTVNTVATGIFCPWGGATWIPPAPVPADFTARFDYAPTCAGSNCGQFAMGSSLSVTASVGRSSSAAASTTTGGGGSSPTGTGTRAATPSLTSTRSKIATPLQSSTSSSSLFPSMTGGAPPAPNESLTCQDAGQVKFHISDASQHLGEYCSAFDSTPYPAITDNPSALRRYWWNSAGVRIELWSTINTQDRSCKVGQVKFSKADCLTALQDAMTKCHDSQYTTGGNAEPFNCADFGFIGDNDVPPPPLTTNDLATTITMPAERAFTCTSSLANPVDPDFPCMCQGYGYCSQSGGGCGWTTRPAAENCCLGCG